MTLEKLTTIKETTRELLAWARSRKGKSSETRIAFSRLAAFRGSRRAGFRAQFFANRGPLTDVTE